MRSWQLEVKFDEVSEGTGAGTDQANPTEILSMDLISHDNNTSLGARLVVETYYSQHTVWIHDINF